MAKPKFPERTLAFVCRKCGQTADDLRSGLKRAAKRDLPKKSLRIVMTDCQGVCPKKAATLTWSGVTRVVHPEEIERTVAELISAVKGEVSE